MRGFAEYFERIYVISLPQRRDRQAEMREQLARIGLRLGEGNVRLFPAIRPAERGEFETIGARGCFLSHLAVLRDAAHAGCARIVILEDDVDFVPDFNTRIEPLLDDLRCMAWSVFYGGHRMAGSPPDGLWPVPADTEVVTAHFLGFQGTAIARAAALLKAFASRRAGDPAGGPMHVDGAYNWYRRRNPSDLTLAAVPPLGFQRSSRTDVHELGWPDRTPVLKATLARLRRLKNRASH